MSNIRIVHENRADAAALTATSEALVVENLQDMQPQVVWRSTTTADQTITIPLTTTRSINCVALMNHNLSGSATITIQAAADAGFSTYLYNQTLTALDPAFGWGEFPWGMIGWGGYSDEGWQYQFSVYWITLTNARYWRIVISDSTNAAGYLQAGRLVVGQYWTPQANMEWGYTLDWTDPSDIKRTRGGSWRSDNKTPYRKINMSFRWLDVNEAGSVLDMKRLNGKRYDMLVSSYPDEGTTRERRNTLLGVMSQWTPSAHNYVPYNSVSMTIEESI